jgi:hypothetical protein
MGERGCAEASAAGSSYEMCKMEHMHCLAVSATGDGGINGTHALLRRTTA